MASFDPTVPTIQPDRNLSYFSQGTDKANLQPLAEVPKLSEKYVSPDYKADTSLGQGLTGAAEFGKAGLSLADNVIKQNIDKTLNDGIDKIRDSFGVAQAADTGSGFAAAVGRGGADGVSLTDQKGDTPVALQKLGTRVDGLTEAYKQGELSNSAYYAKMEAYVRQVKQQFPGFSDDVDQMVSTKLGVTPANALRSAIQQDVTELQKKVQSQNDKWTTYEHTNAQYIYTQWPNYDQLKSQGQAPARQDVEAAVGTLQARDYGYTAGMARLAATKAVGEAQATKAEELTTQKAGDIAAHLTVGVTNSMGIKSPADFQQLLDDVRNGKRPPLTPDEKAQVSGIFATMKQQYGVTFDKFVNGKLSENTEETLASRSSPPKIAAIREQGLQSIKDMEDGLVNEKYGVLAQSSNWNKATMDAGEGEFLRRAPIAPYVAAGRKALGDQGIMVLVANQPFLQKHMLEGFRQFNQAAAVQGDKSLREVFDTYKSEGVNDGELNKKSIADTTNIILHSDKMEDKNAGANAVQHAFGPANRTLLDAFNDKNQVDVFTQLGSPLMTKKISKMDKKSQDTYTGFMDDGFVTVYTAQVSQANQTAANYKSNGNLDVKYDPETQNFSFESKGRLPLFPGSTPKAMVDAASAKLTGLNTAINTMKEVWKLEGKDPTQALYHALPEAGIEPGTPIYKALQTEISKQEDEAIRKAQ